MHRSISVHRPSTVIRLVAQAIRWHWRVAGIAGITICSARTTTAQLPALAGTVTAQPVIAYARNESGGRITMVDAAADSAAIEAIRLRLLESAAAIRRADFRAASVLRADHPALQILAARRTSLRCTFRSTPRGGELVLLSDDDAVVAAIHQLLSDPPPERVRL